MKTSEDADSCSPILLCTCHQQVVRFGRGVRRTAFGFVRRNRVVFRLIMLACFYVISEEEEEDEDVDAQDAGPDKKKQKTSIAESKAKRNSAEGAGGGDHKAKRAKV